MIDLDMLRRRIDSIDLELLRLIHDRVETAIQTKKFKHSIQDKQREEELLKLRKELMDLFPLIPGDFIKFLFQELIKVCCKYQAEEKILIGFQGEHGAYGETAARQYKPDSVTVPYPQFEDIFEEVENGHIDMGIIPVENSIGGSVTQVNELLNQTKLKPAAGISMRITHCFMARKETDYRELRTVYSHPQALMQCRDFLRRHDLKPVSFYDTAGAARMLAHSNSRTAGVIANRVCAQLYGLSIIKEHVEDHPENYTRFLVVSGKENLQDTNKCSIIFSLPNRSGALFSVLKVFSDAKINLSRIESFTDRSNPGTYSFFLDFECKGSQEITDDVLKAVKQKTLRFHSLGCYREVRYQ